MLRNITFLTLKIVDILSDKAFVFIRSDSKAAANFKQSKLSTF